MYIMIMYLMAACPADANKVCQISLISQEYNSLAACGAAGNKVLEKLPLSDINGTNVGAQLGVRWTCQPK